MEEYSLRILYIILMIFLGFCAWKDWKELIIPNSYLIRAILIRFFLLIFELAAAGTASLTYLVTKAAEAVMLLGVGILVRKLSKDGLGMGDVKLFAVMYLYLEHGEWVKTLLCSFGIGLLAAIIFRKNLREKGKMPFAPAVFAGTMLTLMMNYKGEIVVFFLATSFVFY